MLFGDLSLKVVDTSTIEQKLLSDTDISSILKLSEQLTSAVHSHSDLVAGVYEGEFVKKYIAVASKLCSFLIS